MKRIQSINGLIIMQLTKRDHAFDPAINQYIVINKDREEVGVGPASLKESIEFAKCYYEDYRVSVRIESEIIVKASSELDAEEKVSKMSDSQIASWVRSILAEDNSAFEIFDPQKIEY